MVLSLEDVSHVYPGGTRALDHNYYIDRNSADNVLPLANPK